MTFFVRVFLSSSCIFVHRKKYLRWRDDNVFLENGNATRKSQVDLTFDLLPKRSVRRFIYRSRIKYEVRSLNIQNLHIHCNRKYDLSLSQSDLDPRVIDLTLCVNLTIETLYQYQYIAQFETMKYGIIRNDSAYECDITKEKEQGWNGNDVMWTFSNFKNECIVPPQFEIWNSSNLLIAFSNKWL